MKRALGILIAFLLLAGSPAFAGITPTQLPAKGAIGYGTLPDGTLAPAARALTPAASAALASSQVVKASAGLLFSFQVSADSTLSAAPWWIMIYNAASAPTDGAVTPAKCYALPAGATAFSAAFPTPANFSTGITIGVSTSGCFTKTASTHAFISGDAQ